MNSPSARQLYPDFDIERFRLDVERVKSASKHTIQVYASNSFNASNELGPSEQIVVKYLPQLNNYSLAIIIIIIDFSEREKIMYPEFEPNMQLYRNEAKLLLEYMRDPSKPNGYQFDKYGLIIFPLKDRWLRGPEYGFLLRHYKTYSALGYYNVNHRQQDPQVYEQPKSIVIDLQSLSFRWNALLYKRSSFERVWIPKNQGFFKFITAQGFQVEKIAKSKTKDENFFMHCSILYQEYQDDYKNPQALKRLKEKRQKLKDEDINPPVQFERIIMCHILEKDDGLGEEILEDEDEEEELQNQNLLHCFPNDGFFKTSQGTDREQEQNQEKDEPIIAQTISFTSEEIDYKKNNKSISESLPNQSNNDLSNTFEDHSQNKLSIQKRDAMKRKNQFMKYHQSIVSNQNGLFDEQGRRRSVRLKQIKPKSQQKVDYVDQNQFYVYHKKRDDKQGKKQIQRMITIDKHRLNYDAEETQKSSSENSQHFDQQLERIEEDSYEKDLDQFSDVNDSETTEEEMIEELTFPQVKNILKAYINKFRKWKSSQYNSIKRIRWLMSKKTGHYEGKINRWRQRYRSKKITEAQIKKFQSQSGYQTQQMRDNNKKYRQVQFQNQPILNNLNTLKNGNVFSFNPNLRELGDIIDDSLTDFQPHQNFDNMPKSTMRPNLFTNDLAQGIKPYKTPNKQAFEFNAGTLQKDYGLQMTSNGNRQNNYNENETENDIEIVRVKPSPLSQFNRKEPDQRQRINFSFDQTKINMDLAQNEHLLLKEEDSILQISNQQMIQTYKQKDQSNTITSTNTVNNNNERFLKLMSKY
ncbi:UNKNOWN [Stylonychia lemnae]|uniref:Uncharacterized protein n=1 Tax=Stylonychia lemnae TaxID=5949 RepID=A0A078AFA3_STYLE|nr:UNKNOWN [Stylonychia lemnae]|eukprot:CDW79598.1 UNKNOWN [Stylonychia lemnae]